MEYDQYSPIPPNGKVVLLYVPAGTPEAKLRAPPKGYKGWQLGGKVSEEKLKRLLPEGVTLQHAKDLIETHGSFYISDTTP
jgi:hypothetical protein